MQRNHIVSLPICNIRLTGVKALPFNYPTNLNTLGDKIRARRLTIGMLQKEVAEILGTSEDTVTGWENNRSVPQIQFFPKISEFLGYSPFTSTSNSLSEKILSYRRQHGLCRKKFGELIGVHATTIADWEKGTLPKKPVLQDLEKILSK